MSDAKCAGLPLTKTCLYTAYAVMKKQGYVIDFIRDAVLDGKTPDIDTETSAILLAHAKSVLNGLGDLLKRLSKDAHAERMCVRIGELIRAISSQGGVPESMLDVFVVCFRMLINVQQKTKKKKAVSYAYAGNGKHHVHFNAYSYVAESVDKFGKYFRLYMITEEDNKHLYMLSADSYVDDIIEGKRELVVNVDRKEVRKGVVQSLCTML